MKIAMKAVREQKEVSVDELAATSGISKSTIWAYEAGRRSPGPEELCAIADALDCSLDLLVRGKEKDRPEGRSREEILKMYDAMTEEELVRLSALLQAVLADKRFQARLRPDGQEDS